MLLATCCLLLSTHYWLLTACEVKLSGVREAWLRASLAAGSGGGGCSGGGGGRPLGGVTVCFWGRLHLPLRLLAALVRAAGGTVVPSHRTAGVTIVTDDLQHAARHAAPGGGGGGDDGDGGGGGSGSGGVHVAPRVVQPKWIFDQICPPAHAGTEEGEEHTLDAGVESDNSDGISEEY